MFWRLGVVPKHRRVIVCFTQAVIAYRTASGWLQACLPDNIHTYNVRHIYLALISHTGMHGGVVVVVVHSVSDTPTGVCYSSKRKCDVLCLTTVLTVLYCTLRVPSHTGIMVTLFATT